MFELVDPHPGLQRSFLEAADEFLAAGEERYARIPDIRRDPFFEGLTYTRAELGDPVAFAHYTDWLAGQKHPDAPRPEGVVACTELWMVAAGEYVGAISLRHELTDLLFTGAATSGTPSVRRRVAAGTQQGRWR
jgi:predicted acetyltransferase